MIALAWATKITSSAQVEYRLDEHAGCDLEHAAVGAELSGVEGVEGADAQVDYRLAGELRWIGSGLRDVGLVAGEAVDKDAARALMDGAHPATAEQLVKPKLVVAPAARLPAGPYVAAVHAAAEAAGIAPAEVFTHATARARWVRLERGMTRDGDRHTIPVNDLERLAAAARTDLPIAGPIAGKLTPDVTQNLTEATAAAAPSLALEDLYEPGELAEARAHRDDTDRVGVRGTDVVLNVPKSISALHAIASPDVAAAIEAEYMAAVSETWAALEGWAGYAVTGHHGDGQTAARVGTSGLLGWTMLHRSARPVGGRVGDPQLHAHAVIAHLVHCDDSTPKDEKWRVPGSGGRDIYRHVPAAGELAKARVRARLSARFGVAWEHDPGNGEWEIAGIGRELRDGFSARAAQIRAAAEGKTPAQQRVIAARLAESRPDVEPTDVRAQWRATAASIVPGGEAGVDALVAAVMPGPDGPSYGGPEAGPGGPGLGPQDPRHGSHPGAHIGAELAPELSVPLVPLVPSVEDLAAAVWTGEHALTAHTKAVTRVQVLAAVAGACPGGVADVEQLEALTDAVIEAGPTLPLAQLHASHHSNTARWTTRDIVEAEHVITTQAHTRLHTSPGAGVAAVDPAVAEAAVTAWAAERGLTLSGEQAETVHRLVTAGHGVDAVVGVAGAGKTTLMAACRTVWQDAGLSVAGASTAAVASAGLAAEAGITSRTIASWLLSLDSSQPDQARQSDQARRSDQAHQPGTAGQRVGLDGVDVLVVDEAAMVDDRALARLLSAAEVSGTKVVLVGDHLQLRAIGVGGGFKAVHDIVDGATLAENRRQRDPAERQALAVWRDGGRRTALDQLAGAGRVHATELPEQALHEMLAAWDVARARWAGDPHGQLAGLAVLATTNADVDALNAGARAARVAAGELGPDSTYTRSTAAGGGTITLAAGDLVRVRQNDYRSRRPTGLDGPEPDVLNGYRAVVRQVDEQRRVQLEWRRPDHGAADGTGHRTERVWVTPEQIAGGAVSHGYAQTIASAQGMTVDLALGYGTGADAHSLYSGLTRAREATHVWLARTAVEDHITEAVAGPATDADRLARTVAATAAAVERDQPDSLITPQLAPPTTGQAGDDGRTLAQRAEDLRRSIQKGADRQAAWRQAERQRAEQARTDQVVPRWQERPHGSVPTDKLPARIAATHAKADQADARAARTQEQLRQAQAVPTADRLAGPAQALAAADAAAAAAAADRAQAASLATRIAADRAAQYRDHTEYQQLLRVRQNRPLGAITARRQGHAASDVAAQMSQRQAQLNRLELDHRDLKRSAGDHDHNARTLRQQAGAHPDEDTPTTLDRLAAQLDQADQQTAARSAGDRRRAGKLRGTATALEHEAGLRAQLPPTRLVREDAERADNRATQRAAERTAEAERRSLRARIDDDYRRRGPSRGGPSLGR